MARYNKIFAALDGGDTQESVVRRAFSIAHDNNSEVLLGHVIDSNAVESLSLGQEGIVEARKAAIEASLARFLNRAKNDECIPSVDVQVKMGDAAETIMEDFVKPFQPDLIICGVRGLSNIRYAFVGSVSTHIVRHAECDVLTVRAESIEPVNEYDYEQLVPAQE